MLELVAGWKPQAQDNACKHRGWVQLTSDILASRALPGGYPNLLGPDEHQQIKHAYGGNAARLLAVKRQFDPDNVFTAIPLSL